MKVSRNLINLFIWGAVCIFFSCSPKPVRKVTIAVDKACTLEQQTMAYEVIAKRLSIWGVKEKTDLTDGRFDITYAMGKEYNADSDTLLTQILTQRGEVYITEIYQQREIESARDRVYERLFWLMENTDHEPRWRLDGSQLNRPDLINVPSEQVLYIDSIFNSFQSIFPEDMSFAWTSKPNDEGFFDLLPLKTWRKLHLNPKTVKNSSIKDYGGYEQLTIELNEEYIEEWANITRSNIDKYLAIVLDGKVLMYPRVNSEIEGGKLSVSGNFDKKELLFIKSFILGGVLDCEAHIINQ